MWISIAKSWLSLKTWVKLWLFVLNIVFLISVFFLDEPVGFWIFVAYIVSGMFLFVILGIQRGLTRLLGLGHLVPGIPLIIYLVMQLSKLSDPLLIGYIWLVLLTFGMCLILDILDVIRWFLGERYVMGSNEAYQAGASKKVPNNNSINL
jgi:hypothetical protein